MIRATAYAVTALLWAVALAAALFFATKKPAGPNPLFRPHDEKLRPGWSKQI